MLREAEAPEDCKHREGKEAETMTLCVTMNIQVCVTFVCFY